MDVRNAVTSVLGGSVEVERPKPWRFDSSHRHEMLT
jgi:hypothetical protein